MPNVLSMVSEQDVVNIDLRNPYNFVLKYSFIVRCLSIKVLIQVVKVLTLKRVLSSSFCGRHFSRGDDKVLTTNA